MRWCFNRFRIKHVSIIVRGVFNVSAQCGTLFGWGENNNGFVYTGRMIFHFTCCVTRILSLCIKKIAQDDAATRADSLNGNVPTLVGGSVGHREQWSKIAVWCCYRCHCGSQRSRNHARETELRCVAHTKLAAAIANGFDPISRVVCKVYTQLHSRCSRVAHALCTSRLQTHSHQHAAIHTRMHNALVALGVLLQPALANLRNL